MCSAGKKLGIDGMRDMDYVITTRELAQWARAVGIDFTSLESSEYDPLMGKGSGAGVIFGNTGGVMEAAIRTAYAALTGEPVPDALYSEGSPRPGRNKGGFPDNRRGKTGHRRRLWNCQCETPIGCHQAR